MSKFLENVEETSPMLFRDKLELLEAMNVIMKHMNNEDAYFGDWLSLVPDGADDEDLEAIANDDGEYMEQIANCFRANMEFYGRDGFICCGRGVDEVY